MNGRIPTCGLQSSAAARVMNCVELWSSLALPIACHCLFFSFTDMMLVGAFAFTPAPMARYTRPHRALSAAAMNVVESEDTIQAADEVLESLLEAGAPTGMRRKMAEGLRQKQLAITDLVSSADGVTFQGASRTACFKIVMPNFDHSC